MLRILSLSLFLSHPCYLSLSQNKQPQKKNTLKQNLKVLSKFQVFLVDKNNHETHVGKYREVSCWGRVCPPESSGPFYTSGRPAMSHFPNEFS